MAHFLQEENSYKAVLAAEYLREGLFNTIDNALLNFQKTLLSDISSQLGISEAKCTHCTTTEICERKNQCPNGICDKIRTQIESFCYGVNISPEWKFTDASKWCTHYFEIAKCFLPNFYNTTDTTSVKDIDLYGLVSLAIRCRDIQSRFDINIEEALKTIWSDLVSMFSHRSRITREELENYIDRMIIVIQDKKELAQNHTAQECVEKLTKLKDEKFQLSNDDKKRILQEVQEENSIYHSMMELESALDKPTHTLIPWGGIGEPADLSDKPTYTVIPWGGIGMPADLSDTPTHTQIALVAAIGRAIDLSKARVGVLEPQNSPGPLTQATKDDSVTRHTEIDTCKGPVKTTLMLSQHGTQDTMRHILGQETAFFTTGSKILHPLTKDTKRDSVTRQRHINNSKDLRDLCEKHGRKSQEVVEACKRISMEIIVCSRSFKDVWPTYKPTDPDNIVFIVFWKRESHMSGELSPSVSGFDIEYRIIGEYSNEDKEIPTEIQLFSQTGETHRKNLTDILQKISSHFMKEHSNLNIISASPFKLKGLPKNNLWIERTPCIVFSVCLKGYIPIQEDEFPRHLGSYRTDVREGAFALYNDPEPFMQRLQIGCSLGEHINNGHFGGTGGTLGAFVNLDTGLVGCITSAHAILNEKGLFASKHLKTDFKLVEPSAEPTIYQPAPSLVAIPGNEPFGRVTSVVYKTGGEKDIGVEVALVTIVNPDRFPDNGRFPKIKKEDIGENQINFKSGKLIRSGEEFRSFLNKKVSFYKYGAKTGLTEGELRLEAGAVRTSKMNVLAQCELHNQIELCSKNSKIFADCGDSGALVLASPDDDVNDLHAIGILSGGTVDFTKCHVTPIWEVLKALGLPLRLKNFNEPTETENNDNANASLSIESKVDSVTKKVDELGLEIKADKAELKAEMKANMAAIIAAIQNKPNN